MKNIQNPFKQLFQSLMVVLLISLAWLQFPVNPAQAMPNNPLAETPIRTVDTTTYGKSDHLEAIVNCIPSEITSRNRDVQDRVAQAFGEMGNDYLERTFNLTDDPELSDAEIEFERCLRSKGLTPERNS